MYQITSEKGIFNIYKYIALPDNLAHNYKAWIETLHPQLPKL